MTAKDWLAPLDLYCERTDASLWSEPINTVSNGAFLLAAAYALVLWRRADGHDWPALLLIVLTAAVGIGSFLFHTFANRWSLFADVLPIGLFIDVYFLIAMRRLLRLATGAALALTAAFMVFNASFVRLWSAALGPITLNGSVGYLPPALALLVVAGLLRLKAPQARPGLGHRQNQAWSDVSGAHHELLTAAGVFACSLVFRTIDQAVCGTIPVGTHAFWHVLNAYVLFILLRSVINAKHACGTRHPR